MISAIGEKRQWDAVLAAVDRHDFYHTHDYHRLSLREGAEARLIVYTAGETIVALPLILERIPDTELFDCTSVYGYAGPLSANLPVDFDSAAFIDELDDYLRSRAVVTVFSRLNPYIENQHRVLGAAGDITLAGNVVNIDLTLDPAVLRSRYGKSVKNQLNKLERTCSVRQVETDADLAEFVDIYTESMDRLEAGADYYFDRAYFDRLLGSDDFHTEILLASDRASGETLAGSMFVKTRDIVQYHLSGTRTAHWRTKASKLLLDTMRKRAAAEGYRFMNLGGGLGGQADALFEFKASFSKDLRPFHLWRHVVDRDRCDRLTEDVAVRRGANDAACDCDYFPPYRRHAKRL